MPSNIKMRKVTCINKDNGNHDNPHEAIQFLGWIDEQGNRNRTSRLEMVSYLERGNQAYVEAGGVRAYLYVRTSTLGNKFVQTIADSKYSNNLLSLPEC